MSSNAPTVFVSSTYYDLRQIRADMSQFIEGALGYRALLSESPSFPTDPDVDTIENCRRRVQNDADIMVLIVGGRYGYVVPDNGKSVTNLEYLTARAKGIPIYVFIEKATLALLPMWEANPDADFGRVTDNPKLFEFIAQVRSKDSVWTHDFENAQDIITALRTQLAHLMGEGLKFRRQLSFRTESQLLSGLRGRPLRIALEKPIGWEYSLFGELFHEEISNLSGQRKNLDLGIVFGSGEYIANTDMPRWISTRHQEFARSVETFKKLVDDALQDAIGPPGHSGSVAAIVHVAQQFGILYQSMIEWAQRVRRVHAEDAWQETLEALPLFAYAILDPLEAGSVGYLKQMNDALLKVASGESVEVTYVFKIGTFDYAGFEAKFLAGAAAAGLST